jgi:hypothetical protein
MKITIESTTKLVELETPNGVVPARIWEGTTERGTPVHCYVTRIAVDESLPREVHLEFEKDLQEQRKPSAAIQAIPLRLIL